MRWVYRQASGVGSSLSVRCSLPPLSEALLNPSAASGCCCSSCSSSSSSSSSFISASAAASNGLLSPLNGSSSDGDSPVYCLPASTTMKEIFASCDLRKELCIKLVHDLFQAVLSHNSSSSSSNSNSCSCSNNSNNSSNSCSSSDNNTNCCSCSNSNNTNNINSSSSSSDALYRDLLMREEALHAFSIEEACGLQQLEPYLEVFQYCLVGGLMPSQLPPGERAALIWALRQRVLLPRGAAAAAAAGAAAAAAAAAWRCSEELCSNTSSSAAASFPFRERQGVTHRLLLHNKDAAANTISSSGLIGGGVGLNSPTAAAAAAAAAAGTTTSSSSTSASCFAAAPSLFFGPVHAPSSPTAALYGGCFSMATERCFAAP